MASDKLLAFLNMTEEEFEKTMDDFANKMVQEQFKKTKAMYEQRHTLFPLLFQHIKEKNAVDGESMCYFPENYPFSSGEFEALFSLMTDYLEEEHGHAVDEECDFENKSYFLRHEGVIVEFFIMWGQGTCTIVKFYEDEEEVPAELIGSHEQWVSFIEKDYENFKNGMEENKKEKMEA
jgi:hypothetical protein